MAPEDAFAVGETTGRGIFDSNPSDQTSPLAEKKSMENMDLIQPKKEEEYPPAEGYSHVKQEDPDVKQEDAGNDIDTIETYVDEGNSNNGPPPHQETAQKGPRVRPPTGGKRIPSHHLRNSTGGKDPRYSRALARKAKRCKVPLNHTGGYKQHLPKRRKASPAVRALQEIRKWQKTTELIIPRSPFMCLVREIAQDLKPGLRFQSTAMVALQESAESMLVNRIGMWQQWAFHAGRITIMKKDTEFLNSLLKMMSGGKA